VNGDTTKCACHACGNNIEFPLEAFGQTINCPHCGENTVLGDPAPELEPAQLTAISPQQIADAFKGPIRKRRPTFFYQIGLLLVTLVMVILPIIYVAMIAAAGWGVYLYATHFTFLLTSMHGGPRIYVGKLVLYLAPIIAGAILFFFMIKPLFKRRRKPPQSLAMNPAVEQTLFAFIAHICKTVGAPMPTRIDLDCQLNASAHLRRGVWSGKYLVLTLGLPLVAALNTRELAGIIAHEFGHFTQGFGMRLHYVVRTINGWFARVVFERDEIDAALDNAAAEAQDSGTMIIVFVTQIGIGFSRLILMGLMYAGHAVSCFLSRQMEFDADSYEIQLAGSQTFETAAGRFNILNECMRRAYKDARTTWNINKELPENFPAFLLRHEGLMPPIAKQNISDRVGFARTGLLDTHPCDAERIQRARIAAEPGVFDLEAPATELFVNFEAVARQVTILHYVDDLSIPIAIGKLVPAHRPSVPEPVDEKPRVISMPTSRYRITPGPST
jgi:Zn-dependent protease with chaperone function